jgi:hypothetical protein
MNTENRDLEGVRGVYVFVGEEVLEVCEFVVEF